MKIEIELRKRTCPMDQDLPQFVPMISSALGLPAFSLATNNNNDDAPQKWEREILTGDLSSLMVIFPNGDISSHAGCFRLLFLIWVFDWRALRSRRLICPSSFSASIYTPKTFPLRLCVSSDYLMYICCTSMLRIVLIAPTVDYVNFL